MMQSLFLFNIESKILSETKNTTKTHDTRVYNETLIMQFSTMILRGLKPVNFSYEIW